jgi:hypothetical protein
MKVGSLISAVLSQRKDGSSELLALSLSLVSEQAYSSTAAALHVSREQTTALYLKEVKLPK